MVLVKKPKWQDNLMILLLLDNSSKTNLYQVIFDLSRGKTALNDIDLSDEEINDILLSTAFDTKNEEFTSKLKKIVQLTGYSVIKKVKSFIKIIGSNLR